MWGKLELMCYLRVKRRLRKEKEEKGGYLRPSQSTTR
uniref:Uncharacterized protein n=1 Tax=Anguilla anguilla TaxID=7936 RepID=A0A0E9SUX2_ANGAN